MLIFLSVTFMWVTTFSELLQSDAANVNVKLEKVSLANIVGYSFSELHWLSLTCSTNYVAQMTSLWAGHRPVDQISRQIFLFVGSSWAFKHFFSTLTEIFQYITRKSLKHSWCFPRQINLFAQSRGPLAKVRWHEGARQSSGCGEKNYNPSALSHWIKLYINFCLKIINAQNAFSLQFSKSSRNCFFFNFYSVYFCTECVIWNYECSGAAH